MFVTENLIGVRSGFLIVLVSHYVVEKIIGWILADTVIAHLIVEVRATDKACAAAAGDLVTAFHPLAFTNEVPRQVGIECLIAIPVMYHQHYPISSTSVPGHFDDTISGREYGGSHIVKNIQSLMRF